jgi:hypothetical protein
VNKIKIHDTRVKKHIIYSVNIIGDSHKIGEVVEEIVKKISKLDRMTWRRTAYSIEIESGKNDITNESWTNIQCTVSSKDATIGDMSMVANALLTSKFRECHL